MELVHPFPIESITRKGDVDEPFRAATTELTIQKVDTFPEEEKVRPDGSRKCYHGTTSHASPCNKKRATEEWKTKNKINRKKAMHRKQQP